MPLKLPTSNDRDQRQMLVQIVDRSLLNQKRSKSRKRPTASFRIAGATSVEAARRELCGLIEAQNVTGIPLPTNVPNIPTKAP